jgi:DNA-binding response OmpR family regulator
LNLDGHYVLGARDIDEALKVTKRIAIDCVVIDCEDAGISVTTGIARAQPEVPILLVSDQSEVQLQVYSETGMFITKEEAIEQLSRCICEVIRRSVRRCEDDRRKLTRTSNVDSRALHGALVRWLLPW